jgi:hypothetical protein
MNSVLSLVPPRILRHLEFDWDILDFWNTLVGTYVSLVCQMQDAVKASSSLVQKDRWISTPRRSVLQERKLNLFQKSSLKKNRKPSVIN